MTYSSAVTLSASLNPTQALGYVASRGPSVRLKTACVDHGNEHSEKTASGALRRYTFIQPTGDMLGRGLCLRWVRPISMREAYSSAENGTRLSSITASRRPVARADGGPEEGRLHGHPASLQDTAEPLPQGRSNCRLYRNAATRAAFSKMTRALLACPSPAGTPRNTMSGLDQMGRRGHFPQLSS